MVFGAIAGALSRFVPQIAKSIPQITQLFAPQAPNIAAAEQQARQQTLATGGLSKGQTNALTVGLGAVAGGIGLFTQRKRIAGGIRRFRARRRSRGRRRGRRSF